MTHFRNIVEMGTRKFAARTNEGNVRLISFFLSFFLRRDFVLLDAEGRGRRELVLLLLLLSVLVPMLQLAQSCKCCLLAV
jgi:hypothetical protein